MPPPGTVHPTNRGIAPIGKEENRYLAPVPRFSRLRSRPFYEAPARAHVSAVSDKGAPFRVAQWGDLGAECDRLPGPGP